MSYGFSVGQALPQEISVAAPVLDVGMRRRRSSSSIYRNGVRRSSRQDHPGHGNGAVHFRRSGLQLIHGISCSHWSLPMKPIP